MRHPLIAPAVIAFALFLATLPATARAENWPAFRGPTGLGYTQEQNLPITWGGPDRKNVLWEAKLNGQGHASPVVWDDRVFVSTARWPDDVREREKVIPEHHVICYGTADGKVLWDVGVKPGPWLRTDFRSGPGGGYASPTPATVSRSRCSSQWALIITPRSSWYAWPSSTWSVARSSRSRLRTFCDFAYVHPHSSPSRTTYHSGIR